MERTDTYRRLAKTIMAMVVLPLQFTTHNALHAQVGNLGKFDQELLHWGIQVGYTNSKFDLSFSEDDELRESLQGVTSYYAPGFHVSMIGDLRMGKWFSLRLLPGLTLITRDVNYYWEEGYFRTHPMSERQRNVESVYGELPLEVKFRAMRYHNFRPYVTGGVSYGFDIASLRKNRNRTDQSIVRLQAHDLHYTLGLGFDFFLPYVKFAIELKMAFGLVDLKVEDPDVYIRSFDNLNSRTFLLSFTFEG